MAKFQLFKDLRYRRHGGEQFFRHPLQSQVQQRKKETLLTASELLSSHAAMRTDVLDENRKSGVMCDLNGDVPRRATHIVYEYPFFFFCRYCADYLLPLFALSFMRCFSMSCSFVFPHTSELTLLEPFSHPTPPTPPRTPFSFLSVAALCSPALASFHSASRLLSAFFCCCLFVCLFVPLGSLTHFLSLPRLAAPAASTPISLLFFLFRYFFFFSSFSY